MFRAYYEEKGEHVHLRLFAGQHEGALGQCGKLVMKAGEFNLFAFETNRFIEYRREGKYAHASEARKD